MSGIVGISQLTANAPALWHSAAEHSDRLNRSDEAIKAAQTEQTPGPASLSGHTEPSLDLYVHGKELDSAGLYRLAKDENGAPKIIFYAPGQNAAEATDGEDNIVKSLEQPLEENEAPGEDDEGKDKKGDGITIMETAGNCDKVEAEIKKLKQEQSKLSQQMKGCADNPDKQQEMQNRLQQIENELRVKDTDEYRKQHMVITSQRIVKGPNA